MDVQGHEKPMVHGDYVCLMFFPLKRNIFSSQYLAMAMAVGAVHCLLIVPPQDDVRLNREAEDGVVLCICLS